MHLLHLGDNQTWVLLESIRRQAMKGVIMVFQVAVMKVYDEVEGVN